MSDGISLKVSANVGAALVALKSISQAASDASKGFAELKSSISSIAGVAGVGLVSAAFTSLVSSAISAADAVGKLAQEAGASVAPFSALAFATKFSDVSAEDLAVSFKFLSSKMQDALAGGKASVDIFQRLGVAFQNVDGTLRGPDATFRDIVSTLSRLQDGAEKTALTVDLFGRSGQKLIPIINEGTEGLDSWADRAREAGAVISGDLAKQADDFWDSMQLLKEQLNGVFITIAKELLPTLNQLSTAFQDLLKSLGGIGSVLELVRELTSITVGFAKVGVAAFMTVEKVFGGMVSGIVENFSILRDIFSGSLNFLKVATVAYVDFIRDVVTEGPAEAFRIFKDTMQTATASVVDSAAAGLKSKKDGFISLWKGIATDITALWKDSAGSLISPFGRGDSPLGNSAAKDNPVLNTPGRLDKDTSEILRRVNDEYAKATKSKLELLDYERDQQIQKLREQLTDEEEFQGAKLGIERVYAKKRLDILEDQRRAQADIQLSAIRGQASRISGDKDLTQAEKKAQLVPLLQQENALVSQQLDIYRARSQDGSLSDEQRIEAARQINDLEQERVRTLQQIRDLQADTFGGTFRRGLVEMFDEFGNVGRNLANGALKTMRNAVDGITDGIMGAIDGTKTWGQVFAQFAKQMIADLIRIGVQALFVKAITSFIPGIGGFLGIGARASGGPVTKGLYQLGEEGPEYVLNARATSKLGMPALQELNSGRIPVMAAPYTPQMGGGGSGGSGNMRIGVAVVDKRSDYERWTESNHFEHSVMTVVRRNS